MVCTYMNRNVKMLNNLPGGGHNGGRIDGRIVGIISTVSTYVHNTQQTYIA